MAHKLAWGEATCELVPVHGNPKNEDSPHTQVSHRDPTKRPQETQTTTARTSTDALATKDERKTLCSGDYLSKRVAKTTTHVEAFLLRGGVALRTAPKLSQPKVRSLAALGLGVIQIPYLLVRLPRDNDPRTGLRKPSHERLKDKTEATNNFRVGKHAGTSSNGFGYCSAILSLLGFPVCTSCPSSAPFASEHPGNDGVRCTILTEQVEG